jgi:hypothetical protein
MNQQDTAPKAPKAYFASARAYALDLAAIRFLFVSVSVMAGRIWRFPFDDEIATLSKIELDAVRAFVAGFPATDDIHPPLSYAMFYADRRAARKNDIDRGFLSLSRKER